MIPFSAKEAWARLRQIDDDPAEHSVPVSEPQNHDLVVRYAIIGIALFALMTALSIAKAVALPLTAGIIFGLVLGPLVDRLVQLGLPHAAAAGLVVATGVLIMFTIIGVFAAPFAIWSDQLPEIISALKNRFSEAAAMFRRVEGVTKDISGPPSTPVVAVESGSPWLKLALDSSAAAGGLLIFVATIYFYLATRRDLKARALRLCLGASARRSAVQFLEAIENKLASYFAVVTAINLAVGLIAMIIAWQAGLPFPIFWGVLAFILNYIAFVGPMIMMALLLGAGLIEDAQNWWSIAPASAFFLVHLVEGNVVTPVLVGRRLTLSPFLVFVSFVFWLWLWGPVGAILAAPLLLLMVLGFEAAAEYNQIQLLEKTPDPDTGPALPSR